jgi:hypothetical protein
MEFDAAEAKELDRLAERTRKCGISWEDFKAELGLYEAISHLPRTSALLCGLRIPAPSASLPSINWAPEGGCLQVAMAWLLTSAKFFAIFLAQER